MDVAPATLTAPATRVVHNPSQPPVVPATPQPATATRASAATQNLQKTPATVHTPQGAQQPSVVQQQTSATLVAPCQSVRIRKPPT